MGHHVPNDALVRILTVEIAVPYGSEGAVADQISWLLSECGAEDPNSLVLDWTYKEAFLEGRLVQTGEKVEEGEVFQLSALEVADG